MQIAYMLCMTNQFLIAHGADICVNQSQNCLHLSVITDTEIHVLIT